MGSRKEQDLLQSRQQHQEEVDALTKQLKSLPDPETVKKEADKIRRKLLKQYGSKERLTEMSIDDKRALLHWLFEGKDDQGTAYGIYITISGNRNAKNINYFIYGKIIGIRTLKDSNINFVEDDVDYKTKILDSRQRK